MKKIGIQIYILMLHETANLSFLQIYLLNTFAGIATCYSVPRKCDFKFARLGPVSFSPPCRFLDTIRAVSSHGGQPPRRGGAPQGGHPAAPADGGGRVLEVRGDGPHRAAAQVALLDFVWPPVGP